MMKREKIVLLNPPSKYITIRDNFCSKVSQAFYINHPIDLLIQSGFLARDFEIVIIDAVVQRKSATETIAEIRSLNPVGIYALAGNASWEEDRFFFEKLKQSAPHSKLVVSGDLFLESPQNYIDEYSFIDAILLDFTDPNLGRYFSNLTVTSSCWVHRDGSSIPPVISPAPHSKSFEIPVPCHEKFISLKYRYPFVKKNPFATVMTEYGCPFNCAFCVMGTLGHKLRPVDNVMAELIYLKSLGIRDVFFVDQSFGSNPSRNDILYDRMMKEVPLLRWLCFSRVDLLDVQKIEKMKSAGCHTVILGVETADPQMLQTYRKGYSLDQVKDTFTLLRKLGIRSVATFLLGLPGETYESAIRTINFAKNLQCDFASINVAVPRMGTDLRKWALEKGYIQAGETVFDQSGSKVVMNTDSLTSNDLLHLKKQAIRTLYFNPAYIWKRILSLTSWNEFVIQSREGWHLLKNMMSKYNEINH